MIRPGCQVPWPPTSTYAPARLLTATVGETEHSMAIEYPQMNLQSSIEEVGKEYSPTSTLSVLAIASGTRSSTELSKIMATVPRSVRWWGRQDRPWGLGDDFAPRLSRSVNDLETVRMGKASWFFRADGRRSYDTLREAFVGERLNGGGQNCGCISAYAFGVATIDCDAQLELMREVMKRILREMSNLDLTALCTDLFAGQRQLCEHYLWWLENEAFVAHPIGQERQDRLMLTDEGCVALAMLEMTKSGSNFDLSPKSVHEMRAREGSLADADKPRFLNSV